MSGETAMSKARVKKKQSSILEPAPLVHPVFKEVFGFIEAVDESGIYGWAYDKQVPAQPITLFFHIDGQRVAEIACVKLRKDVLEAGHPRAEVGFQAHFPREYCDGGTHIYHFTDPSGTEVSLHILDGIPRDRSFCWNLFFDADFYRKHYTDAAWMSDPETFQHWLKEGTAAGRFPNADKLLEHLEQNGAVLPDDFSAKIYRRLNTDITDKVVTDWEAAVHYLETGKSEGRSYKITGNRFVIDLYFDGVPPNGSDLQHFLTAPPKTIYLSLEELLLRNGIASQTFLRELRPADYAADNPEAKLRSLMQCIRHFAEEGIKECRPLSFDLGFDHVFVSEIDNEYAHLSEASAYLHWINSGIDNSVAPNAAVFLRRLGLADVSRFPPDFDADVYLGRNPDLKGSIHSRWAALQHFVQQGLAEGRQGCSISKSNCDLYRTAADRLAVSERLDTAKRIYEVLLAQDPDFTLGLRHYADCLLRLNDHYAAAQVYEKTILRAKANIWTYLNLASCYTKLTRWRDACEIMSQARSAYPGDRGLVRRHEEVLRQSYNELLSRVDWLSKNRFYSQAKTLAREACELLSAPLSSMRTVPAVLSKRIASIAIVADLGLPQCKFYRVDQKVEQCKSALVSCDVFDYRSELESFTQQIPWLDAVIFYRVPARPDVMRAVTMARAAGLPVFFEIDDLMFDDHYFPDTFESYGGQITHDLYASLVVGTQLLAAVLSASDYALASTPALAQAMQKRVASGRSFVHRNALSSRHEKSHQAVRAVSPRKRDLVRIFYGSGTKAHNEDFELYLARPLRQLLTKWGDKLEIVILGYLTLPSELKDFTSQISMHEPIWDLHTYWGILAETDINIAILKPGIIADCKSEIKWLEAAMLGIPSVVSATQTYREIIENGITGILAETPKDWFAALDSLVADSALRTDIGRAAKQLALRNYSVRSMSDNLRGIFESVVGAPKARKKKILVVNVFFAPQSIGGATRVVADNIHDMLANHGADFDFQVFCTLEGGAKPYVVRAYSWEGVNVTSVAAPSEANIDLKAWDERMAEIFARVVERFEPDIVHLHCIQRLTVSICRVLREKEIPYLVTVHDGWWISDQQFLVDDYGVQQRYNFADPLRELHLGGRERFERMKLKQEYLTSAARVLAVSEAFADIYRGSGFTNVIAVENGVSTLEVLSKRPSADGLVRIAHIGGASAHKGYNLLRAALYRGEFEHLHLLVIDHAMDAAAERYAVWGKTPVTFRGRLLQSRVPELYSEIDVLLAPSVWPESYGLVAREAILAGCWVVASNRGAIGKDITPDNGFVIGVESYRELQNVLSEIDRDPPKYKSPPKAVPTIRTAAQQAETIVKLYKALLSGGSQDPNLHHFYEPTTLDSQEGSP
jgi:glycosyltransferase involved in cell wall biosynthesis/tetratricopeptide (TPR) repeat protein